MLASVAIAAAIAVGLVAIPTSNAELDNGVFTSKAHGIRLVVPRGWRATDQPSYPGLLLWMLRNQPDGAIVLTAQPFTHNVYCSWPIECRNSADPLPNKLACALRAKLTNPRTHIGPTQGGPKENAQNGVPSVWFELDDGKRFLRQAVAIGADRVISLTLSTATAEARGTHVRAFEQALRTLRPMTPEELGLPAASPEQVVLQMVDDAGVPSIPGDATTDAGAAPTAAFETAPTSKVEPVGPCANN